MPLCPNQKLGIGHWHTFEAIPVEEITALTMLEATLIDPPVLELLRPPCDFTVDSDTCHNQIGCVLPQKQLNGTC